MNKILIQRKEIYRKSMKGVEIFQKKKKISLQKKKIDRRRCYMQIRGDLQETGLDEC